MEEIGNMDHVLLATLYECIGQSFAIVGMAIAKASLGSFLLRLVVVPWHKMAIWFAMVLVTLASIGELSTGPRGPRPTAHGAGPPRDSGFRATRKSILTVELSAQVLVFWLACVPLKFVYDRNIPGGSCPIDTRPTSYILCGMFAFFSLGYVGAS